MSVPDLAPDDELICPPNLLNDRNKFKKLVDRELGRLSLLLKSFILKFHSANLSTVV